VDSNFFYENSESVIDITTIKHLMMHEKQWHHAWQGAGGAQCTGRAKTRPILKKLRPKLKFSEPIIPLFRNL